MSWCDIRLKKLAGRDTMRDGLIAGKKVMSQKTLFIRLWMSSNTPFLKECDCCRRSDEEKESAIMRLMIESFGRNAGNPPLRL